MRWIWLPGSAMAQRTDSKLKLTTARTSSSDNDIGNGYGDGDGDGDGDNSSGGGGGGKRVDTDDVGGRGVGVRTQFSFADFDVDACVDGAGSDGVDVGTGVPVPGLPSGDEAECGVVVVPVSAAPNCDDDCTRADDGFVDIELVTPRHVTATAQAVAVCDVAPLTTDVEVACVSSADHGHSGGDEVGRVDGVDVDRAVAGRSPGACSSRFGSGSAVLPVAGVDSDAVL